MLSVGNLLSLQSPPTVSFQCDRRPIPREHDCDPHPPLSKPQIVQHARRGREREQHTGDPTRRERSFAHLPPQRRFQDIVVRSNFSAFVRHLLKQGVYPQVALLSLPALLTPLPRLFMPTRPILMSWAQARQLLA
jgi:hypothetical protein